MLMPIYPYDSYKDYIRAKIRSLPRNGRGYLLKISQLLGVHTTMITHVLRGKANFSVEQGLKLCSYWGLSELETDFFILLLQLERASSPESRAYYQAKVNALRTEAVRNAEKISAGKKLSEADMAIFYSDWLYSGIRLLCATTRFSSPEEIAEALHISPALAGRILRFLVDHGLLVQREGYYEVSTQRTFVPRNSPWVKKHHQNWRLKAIEQLSYVPDDELAFTDVITVSAEDYKKILEEILGLIRKFRTIADPSPPESLCYLLIDWRKLRPIK